MVVPSFFFSTPPASWRAEEAGDVVRKKEDESRAKAQPFRASLCVSTFMYVLAEGQDRTLGNQANESVSLDTLE